MAEALQSHICKMVLGLALVLAPAAAQVQTAQVEDPQELLDSGLDEGEHPGRSVADPFLGRQSARGTVIVQAQAVSSARGTFSEGGVRAHRAVPRRIPPPQDDDAAQA